MCGIAGWLARNSNSISERVLHLMGDAIVHRGPDSSGIYIDKNLGMVHRRLAIQDLSELGAQPMASASGRYHVVFNGEIYNFKVLSKELALLGHKFNGHSDTEVILAAIEQWGLEQALSRFAGMFAIALYDTEAETLSLVRDRMGEKPLYYGWTDAGFVFASELKSLRVLPDWQPEINRNSLTLLLRHNFIPAPHSIYKGIFKLLPAHYLTIPLNAVDNRVQSKCYWQLEDCFNTEGAAALGEPVDTLVDTLVDRVENKLSEIIGEQMMADRPLGAFLSGGVDSSTIVALMQRQATRPVKTYSIGFHEKEYNEAEYAKAVAEHLGTEHQELYVTADDALSLVKKLPSYYDEPFADSSQMPTLLLSQMTRKHVTVALSGDGGDELFCGYSRYPATVNAWNQQQRFSSKIKNRLMSALPNKMMAYMAEKIIPSMRGKNIDDVVRRFKQKELLAKCKSLSEYYQQTVSYWREPESVVLGAKEPPYSMTDPLPETLSLDEHQLLMWRDLNWYLPDDILTKVDRASMAHSLETRVPMLDHRFVALALGLPLEKNLTGGVGKDILRKVLYRHVPRELIERPKQGFAVPIAAWLRGPLRDWAEALLDEKLLQQQGYFSVAVVRQLWRSHILEMEDYAFELWGILMFQAWLQEHHG